MKIATLEDISVVQDMGLSFLRDSPYKDYGNEEVVKELIVSVINSSPTEKIVIFSEDEGFIMGVALPFLFGTQLLATEIAWWVNPTMRGTGVGKKLLEAFEYWAKNVANCEYISMTSIDDEVGNYYKSKGYGLYERAYMKVL